MSNSASSVIVVEIDTRKGQAQSLFDSSLEFQSEQARQFWKTITLPPHLESSFYSKEISQQLKANKLQPMTIDNSRKPAQTDPKTDEFLKNVEVLNHVDGIMHLQKRFEKFQAIKESHRNRSEQFSQIVNINRKSLNRSSTDDNLAQKSNQESEYRGDNNDDKNKEDDYELDYEDEENVVKNLD